MKSVRCILAIIIYSGLFVLYIYELPRPYVPVEYCKGGYCLLTASMIGFCLYDSKTKRESWWHRDFNTICFLTLIVNFGIMALHYFGVIEHSFYVLTVFGISTFIVSLIILVSGSRHREFQ